MTTLILKLDAALVWLDQFLPFELRAGGRLFSAATGFMFLTLASNLLRRKRLAWLLVVGLLVVSIISHLLKGLDIEEAVLSGVLLGQLLLMRSVFTAQSDRPSIGQGTRVLIGSLLFTLAYGTAGFFFLDREYAQTFSLGEALGQTLALFFTGNADLQPTTRLGRFFVNSVYIIGAVTLFYALWLLLRPVLFRSSAATAERQQAKTMVEQYGRSSLARFALLSDKSYYFSPSGQSVVAYVPKGRGAIALGDPIGPATDRKEAIAGFQQFCAHNDWYPSFYQTLPDDLDLYKAQGFQIAKIGEEAVVDLHQFTLEGKAGRKLRAPVNKLAKQGGNVQFYQPPIAADLLKTLRTISDEWLSHVNGSEKQFSLGWFDNEYIGDCEVATVETAAGEVVAFANIVSEYQVNDITIDLMRHKADVDRGTMDVLFVSMFQHFKAAGYDGFNLGLSALSGVGTRPDAPRLEKGLHYLSEHLERFYSFQGLHEYKDKFHPRWEPRYLVYPNLVALPAVVAALIRADSGDRLLDYFKPGD
ncbi:phosphatidylglycerol lysyltransferase domain-containing protein [Leptolyngbya sp. BC1307]|uniref:bifunctional lysylphosphatidylglycerol flippase/synthetase MprF n=1 Tax=Leptolyngbya sp. BC1307 TaxID=2029589 RepID=UPI00197EBAAE|nr:phosphatidylglycerol lysyltransferase domain-containing protein [Leptolyngbya sp. BC1307]